MTWWHRWRLDRSGKVRLFNILSPSIFPLSFCLLLTFECCKWTGVSYGLDGTENAWRYFCVPTPGQPNGNDGLTARPDTSMPFTLAVSPPRGVCKFTSNLPFLVIYGTILRDCV